MSNQTTATAQPADQVFARNAFSLAWLFFAIVALLGVGLRWQSVRPVPGVNYAYFLHAHSHGAFLGWIFNAFFALAMRYLVAPAEVPGYRRLFWFLQFAVLGMLVSFPLQGYGVWSISFSTLHMIGSGVFAWKLWRSARVAAVARGYLKVALAFLVLSGAGPLALGPLAAAGLRDTPWYSLAIYFYLHCQYNGWFMFFLLAILLQQLHERGREMPAAPIRRALAWLMAGGVLTYALSTLWTQPPAWVRGVALAGGAAQLVGAGYFLTGLRAVKTFFAGAGSTLSRGLLALALGAFLLKLLLQFFGAWPALADLTNHRFVVIGFMHLIFLGTVTPALVAWALDLGWINRSRGVQTGLVCYIAGAAVSEFLLAGQPFAAGSGRGPWAQLAWVLLFAAGLLATGILLIGTGLIRPARERD